MKHKVILTDVDGVLLDWEYAFHIYMTQHGFDKSTESQFKYRTTDRYNISEDQATRLVKIFNESAHIGFLPALRDAMHYVKRLHEEHGYIFHCITSLSSDPNAQELRKMNLKKLFGQTTFEKFIILETSADKDDALAPYKDTGCWWIEDKWENAEVGQRLGLNSLVMEHGHNMNMTHPNIRHVKNWAEIYNIVTS